MATSPEERTRIREERARVHAELQATCDEWNKARGLRVTIPSFRPVRSPFAGFNRKQRRDGTAKRAIVENVQKRRRWHAQPKPD